MATTTLFLMRHGPAEDDSPDGDFGRRLTAAGDATVQQVLERQRDELANVQRVLTSPLKRAWQTAERVTQRVGLQHGPWAAEALASGGGPDAMVDEILVHTDVHTLLVVGHMPDLCTLSYRLLADAKQTVSFKPAAIARVDFAQAVARQSGTLAWYTAPE